MLSSTMYELDKAGLDQPDHCLTAQTDFSIPVKNNINFVKDMITGLTNTVGGIVRIKRKPDTKCDALILDKWIRDIDDHLNKFLIDMLQCISIEPNESDSSIFIYVKKSRHFITVNSFMKIRSGSRKKLIVKDHTIADVISQTVRKLQSSDLFHESAEFYQNTTINIEENDHMECKHWNISRKLDQRKKDQPNTPFEWYKYLIKDQAADPIFSFANKIGGGRLVIGIREVAGRGYVIEGEELSLEDEERLRSYIQCFLERDPDTGEPRIWGEEGITPTYGVHWEMITCPVSPAKTGQRFVLIVISVNQCPGGQFIRCPESYVIRNSRLHRICFKEWKFRIKSSSGDGASGSSKDKDEPAGEIDPSTTHHLAAPQLDDRKSNSTELETNVDAVHATEQTPRVFDKTEVDYQLNKESNLSWLEMNEAWKKHIQIESRERERNIIEMASKSDVLAAKHPLRFTPDIAVIKRIHPNIDEVLSTIKSESKKGFSIGSSILLNWFHNETKTNLPVLKCHVMDVLVAEMCEKSNCKCVHVWVVVEHVGDELENQKLYLYLTGLAVKQYILESIGSNLKNPHPIGLPVCCHLYSLSDGKVINENRIPPFFEQTLLMFEDVKKAIADMLMSRPTRLNLTLQDEANKFLTCDQIKAALGSDLSFVNMIYGPPGSGKSLLGFFLCNLFGKKNSVYVIRNPAFKALVDHLDICSTILVPNEEAFGKLFDSNELKNKKCVIMDDVHIMNFPDALWQQLLQCTIKRKQKICLLGDNKVQDYVDPAHMRRLRGIVTDVCDDKDIELQIKRINGVHRNTQKIAAYLKATTGREDPLTSTSPFEGHDVEIMLMSGIKEDKIDNPLIRYIQSITTTPMSTETSFVNNQIAVMVDSSSRGDAMFYLHLLGKYCPVQDIRTVNYPTTDICLGLVDDFHGLDAVVCICITSFKTTEHKLPSGASKDDSYEVKQPEVTEESDDEQNERTINHVSLSNSKYRSFVASRAVHKLVYVTEKHLSTEKLIMMGFDPRSYSETRNYQTDPVEEIRSKAAKLCDTETDVQEMGHIMEEIKSQSIAAYNKDDNTAMEVFGRYYIDVMMQLLCRKTNTIGISGTKLIWDIMKHIVVTDVNCDVFVKSNGLQNAFECMDEFFDKESDLVDTILIAVCYIAFKRTRKLYEPNYLRILLKLLDSSSGRTHWRTIRIILRLLVYGDVPWDDKEKAKATKKMTDVLDRLDIMVDTGIDATHLRIHNEWLVSELPVVQYYAAWTMCNFSHKDPRKYCQMLHRDVGVEHLVSLVDSGIYHERPARLIQQTIENIRRHTQI